MTIAQAINFYKQDKEEYIIEKNKEILKFLSIGLDHTKCEYYAMYHEFQDLIDYIANWYEIKYPEYELRFLEDTEDFDKTEHLSKYMDIKQLMIRLPENGLSLLEDGYYYGNTSVTHFESEEFRVRIFIPIEIKKEEDVPIYTYGNPYKFYVYADMESGKVESSYDLERLIGKREIILDELLDLFKKNFESRLDFSELEKCIWQHNYDIKLRQKILQLVALKLLYSRHTNPERGYERAKRFINEFNRELNLKLETTEIDEIISRNYDNDINKQNNDKKYVNNKEIKKLKKVKNLIQKRMNK